MNQKKKLLLFFAWVFLLMTFLYSPITIALPTSPSASNYTTKATAVFVEDFTTTNYRDTLTTETFGWGTGAITKDRIIEVTELAFYETDAPVYDIEVQGRKLYGGLKNKTAGSKQIFILDISNLTNINLLGFSTKFMNSISIAVDGDMLFAGQYIDLLGGNGIVSYNITDPFTPSWKLGAKMSGIVSDLDIEGHLLYFTDYHASNSLKIFNATTLILNYLGATNWTSSQGLGLEVNGHLAYIAASTEGFYVLNVSQHLRVKELGYTDTPGNATDVLIEGRFAYVADGPEGVQIINIQNPLAPQIISSFNTPGNARRLAKQGNSLFIADGLGGVIILDIANPYHPTFVSELVLPRTFDVDLYGDILTVATTEGVFFYRIGTIVDISSSGYDNPFNMFEVWDVRVKDGIAYVAGGKDGFYTVDVRNPRHPVLLDNITVHSGIDHRKLDINGQFAFCVNADGIYIYDIRDPTNIELVKYEFGISLTDAFVDGELLYVSHVGGFAILNFSSVSSAFWINVVYNGMSNATAIWVQRPFLYIVEGTPGSSGELRSYNIIDLNHPQETFSASRIPTHYDIFVDGDCCFLGAGGWLSSYNCSNHYAFTYPDWVTTPSIGVWAFGPYILSAEYSNGVVLYDIADTSKIKTLSQNTLATKATQIMTSGDYTYVANRSSLVILRHLESTADSYVSGPNIAQSTKINTIDGRVSSATLSVNAFVPDDTSVEYFMSADGGLHWELVVPGVPHNFLYQGKDLRWRAVLYGPSDRSVHIYSLLIDYTYNAAPTIPSITSLATERFTGIFKLEWTASVDTDDNVDHYELQLSDSNSFTTILKSWNVTKTTKSIFGLKKGTFFFRVRAVDNYDIASDWSSVETTTVKMSTFVFGIILGVALVALIGITMVIFLVVKRKKKTPTR